MQKISEGDFSVRAEEKGNREFDVLVDEIEKEKDQVIGVTDMVLENAALVLDAVTGLDRISIVVDENVEIFQNMQQVFSQMAAEASRLHTLTSSTQH